MVEREWAILATLVAYKACLVLIGWLYRKRTRDTADFYLAGRRLNPLVASVSAAASSSSAWTLLGVSGAAYAWGVSAFWLFPACVGGFLLNWLVLAPALQRQSRRDGTITLTEVLSRSVDARSRRLISSICSGIILLSLGTYVASQFQGAGKTFSETFDLSLSASVLIGAAIVVIYTLLGGFWAVSVTDTIQGLLMALTSVVLPAAALIAVGGPLELIRSIGALPENDFSSLTQNLPFVTAVGFALGLLGIGLGYPGQPHVVNRFMALADQPGAVRRARRIAITWAVVVYAGMLLVGWSGRILLPGLSDPEVVFITMTNQLFPPVVAGVMLAAVLSAIMSTADSQLLVASSSVTHDLGLGRASSLSSLARSRLVVLLLSGAAVAGALLGSREIFSQVLFAWAAMGCAFGPLVLVLVYKNNVRSGYRISAILTGFLTSVSAYYLIPSGEAWAGSAERVLPFFLALTIVWFGTFRIRKSESGVASDHAG